MRVIITCKTKTYRSGETSLNSFRFAGFTCARREAARTNCPTQLANLRGIMSISPIKCTRGVPGQECVEGEVGDKDAVEELDDAGKHEED